ncbi:TlyA family RNA methyltransferase [Hoeflea prorocentri]|uniref:TlyA family RNA methyltransferase n=1 Tax=Hoeflea prorocentri TaxID=1922333 RepID=A0A9X3ZIC2_9HYPH|nr:TlyA family RNA methyltransferase [Hoeflea prorocentri]MCY6381691.1 TlyA family RNA methyltransferase [Hoeflea prorocentri]MDA5399491.1 TlyA family RNA methyltransferase [Hoeflea prorocentri]
MATAEDTIPQKVRLDVLLCESGRFETRARARDAVVRGTVEVDGTVCKKPGIRLSRDAAIRITDPADGYVSRAALKLITGLEHFGFDPAGRNALDIGASTGGFSQVLLERGAAHVTAIDVGHGQLHPSLASDERVSNLEGINARHLTRETVGDRPAEAVVSDVSFISLKLALPPALAMAEPGSFCVLLVKPQFEAGKGALGKGGILRDPELANHIAEDLSAWLDAQPGWKSLGTCPSPISGGDGNREFLLGGLRA